MSLVVSMSPFLLELQVSIIRVVPPSMSMSELHRVQIMDSISSPFSTTSFGYQTDFFPQ